MENSSIKDKTVRNVTKPKYTDNYSGGYVPVHEQDINDTESRSKKTFAFWSLVGLLFILAVGNLILTMTILGVLRLGQGMQSLEFVPDRSAVKLFGNTDLNDIYKRDGRIEGFQNYPIDITGLNGSIIINVASKSGRAENKLIMDQNGTHLKNLKEFEVKTPQGKLVFTTSDPEYNILKKMENINSKIVETDRVVSPVNNRLTLNSNRFVHLKGAEGTSMEGSEILLSADQDIFLKSINGSIVFSGKEGTFIDTKKLPIMIPKFNDRLIPQYKVCVCMPQGKLFKIPVSKGDSRTYCNHINLTHYNPCI